MSRELRVDSFDAADPVFQADPYATYAFMRERAPVHSCTSAEGEELTYCFRHRDVLEVLRSPDVETTGIAREVISGLLDEPDSPLHNLARIVGSVLLSKDGEDHRRLRSLVNQAFTPRMVESLRPRIEAIVDELLAGLVARGEMDLLTGFAAPLPIIVIAEMLGMPVEDRADLRRWSDRMVTFIDGTIRDQGIASAAAAADELCAYMERIIEARRREPRDDLISGLVAARDQGDRLDTNELLGTIALIMGAGHETTTNLIGNGMLALLRNPDQLDRLRREPERIGSAVEELLRFDSPVQLTSRIPLRDLVVSGEPVGRGREVVVFLGSGNRDPEVFTDPDVLDIARDEARPLSFGHGAHFCLGASLARLEGQVAIAALVERLPNLKLASDELAWRPGIVLRGLRSLPLRF